MLKAVIAIMLVGLAVAEELKWDTIPVAENASQCIFRREAKKLSCRGLGGIVECPAGIEFEGAFPANFEVFGLRRDEDKSKVTPIENRIFELYPRTLDNGTYLNFTVKSAAGEPVELYLYYGEEVSHSGLRVTERKCFVRLIDVVFNKAAAKQVVEIKDGGHVELFGEILATAKPTKRFLFPWLFGMGLWGWGLGWGLPFFG